MALASSEIFFPTLWICRRIRPQSHRLRRHHPSWKNQFKSEKTSTKKFQARSWKKKFFFFANSRRHQRTSSSTPSERRRHRRRRRCRCRRGNFGLSRKPNHVGRSKIYERSYQNVGNRAVQPGTNPSKHLISNSALLGITVFILHIFWWQLK